MLLAVFAVGMITLGALLWVFPAVRGVDFSVPNEASDYTAYLGAHSLAAGFSALTVLVFWGLWHRLETTRVRTREVSQA